MKVYITRIIGLTRNPSLYGQPGILKHIAEGVSPRGTLALAQAAQAMAWLSGHKLVEFKDVDSIAKDVLRHRIKLDDSAYLEHLTIDQIIEQLLSEAKKYVYEKY